MQKVIPEKPLKDVARFIAPMRPKMVPSLPDDRSKWLLEPKLDGYRVVAMKSDGRTNIYSMDAKLYNKEFPAIYDAVSALFVKDVVLDGEIVAVEPTGRPNFNALQNRRSTKLPIYYVVFDCLHFKGRDLLDKPIEERKQYLAEIATGFISPMQPIFEFGSDVDLATATSVVKQTKIEGLVAKRLGSHYYPGDESDLWLKQRFNQEDKFFIGGYLPGNKGIGELLIGEYREDGKLYHVKRLIAGLNQFNRSEIYKAVQDLRTKRTPFVNLPEKKGQHQHAMTEEVMAQAVWLKPEQPAEIEFVERTPHGRLRHASFRRLLPRSGEKIGPLRSPMTSTEMVNGSTQYATLLRRELCARNASYAALHQLSHVTSYGEVPVVVYQPSPCGTQHGNFIPASYRAIQRRPQWKRRFEKVHSQAGRAFPKSDCVSKELDSSMSSDALLMNIFCYPGVTKRRELSLMLGTDTGDLPEFGFKPRIPLTSGFVERTEIDMKLGPVLFEAKLTESDFQTQKAPIVEGYSDLKEVFDCRKLARRGQEYVSYQLLRNVLAAYALNLSFCVLLDARRPDLCEQWYAVMSCVRPMDLKTRCKVLTWQELSAALPLRLQRFLELKYGIAS